MIQSRGHATRLLSFILGEEAAAGQTRQMVVEQGAEPQLPGVLRFLEALDCTLLSYYCDYHH